MTGRTKNSTEKTSYVVFKFDFCKSRNLSSIEGTLPLEFPEMPSPEKYQECQTGFEKVMDSLLERKDGKPVATYDVFMQLNIPSSAVGSKMYFCEDLTEKYRKKFPNEDIHAVVRRLVLSYVSEGDSMQVR